MAYEPRLFLPYEPFLLGVGVVFNLLTCTDLYAARKLRQPVLLHRACYRADECNRSLRKSPHAIVTLPALQKKFVSIFFVFAWEFCIEKWRGLWVHFSGLRFQRNEARKILENFGENLEQNSGQNSGQKF